MEAYYGELAALFTVVCWVICSIAFEAAGRRVGSLAVNLIRLIMALVFISVHTLIARGMLLPLDATPEAWFWLTLSGVVGFFIGDLCLFQAYMMIGARISLLIYSLAPPITAVMGYLILGEVMGPSALVAMAITLGGISLVILKKENGSRKVKFSHPVKGIFLAFLGAMGQSFGLILSKIGLQDYDAFAATQIRIIAATVCFAFMITLLKRWKNIFSGLRDLRAMGNLTIGSLFGPYLGVSFSLVAISFTTTGIVSTITSIIPVVIIIPSVVIFKEKVTIREITGALIAVAGVILLFI